ncbi:MAG: hypothetical protein KBS59_00515 [Clostridiales bacterium]|nr:hypothetical protein [Clostridiales bacterium]
MKKSDSVKKHVAARCEDCEHYDIDEYGEYFCTVDLDEDDEVAFRAGGAKVCPYFKFYDEYKSVQKQN